MWYRRLTPSKFLILYFFWKSLDKGNYVIYSIWFVYNLKMQYKHFCFKLIFDFNKVYISATHIFMCELRPSIIDIFISVAIKQSKYLV